MKSNKVVIYKVINQRSKVPGGRFFIFAWCFQTKTGCLHGEQKL